MSLESMESESEHPRLIDPPAESCSFRAAQRAVGHMDLRIYRQYKYVNYVYYLLPIYISALLASSLSFFDALSPCSEATLDSTIITGSVGSSAEMKFRPLRIDYHARAQEIIITERNYNSRRAAQSLLSHRRSEDLSPCHHDVDDIDESFVLNDEDEENRNPSSSLIINIDGDFNHRKYHPVDSKSNERPASARQEGSIASAPRSSAHNGNRSIPSVFGPTIHPSECELRKISPVTKGPIRGRLLPVPETIPAMERIIGLHAKIGGDQFRRNIFSSFEGDGESRRQQRSFIDDAAMFLQSGYTTVEHHPMQIMDEANNSFNVEAADTIELANAPYSPPYKLLRHEPDDITKIQSLKSLQITNTADFASEVIKLMEPRRRSSPNTECGLPKVVKERPTLSAKPRLTFIPCEVDENSDFVLNKNELSLTSLYEDCHGRLDDFGNVSIALL